MTDAGAPRDAHGRNRWDETGPNRPVLSHRSLPLATDGTRPDGSVLFPPIGSERPTMTLTVGEFTARLAARTHPERAASWDAVGLQVGDPAELVRTIAVVHELTESVVTRLESAPVDLVVAYHPLIFRPVSRLVPDRSPSGRAIRLLQAGVAVVVTHSDFDSMPGGMSDAMADALGLTDVTGFAPVAAAD